MMTIRTLCLRMNMHNYGQYVVTNASNRLFKPANICTANLMQRPNSKSRPPTVVEGSQNYEFGSLLGHKVVKNC